MRGYGAGIDPITSGHFPFRNKLCMFIGDYDMFPVKIEVILDFKTDPMSSLPPDPYPIRKVICESMNRAEITVSSFFI